MSGNKRVMLNCLNCTVHLSGFSVRGLWDSYVLVVQMCLTKVTQALRCMRFQNVSTSRYVSGCFFGFLSSIKFLHLISEE